MHLRAAAQRTATLLTRNPRLFCRVVAGKLRTPRRLPACPAVRCINDVVGFECASDREAPLFFGSYAPLVTHAMERFLKPGDVFIDVGANVGYISAVAAALVGTHGQVHAFEPAPEHFARLRRVVELNPDYPIFANSCAIDHAAAKRTLHITREAGQSTLIASYKHDEVIRCEDVQAVRLDSYIERAGIERVALIKIDVEGYELPVLMGLEGYFRRTGHRPPVICEIAPRAYPLLGANLSQVADYMASFGYAAFDLADGTSSVNLRALNYVDDVLFLAEVSS